MAQRVTLDELDPGIEVPLSPDEAAALASTGLVEVSPTRTRYRLTPRGRVGVVAVGDWQIQVRPKDGVRLAHLMFLLGYARDPGFRADDITGAADDDLWPAMAHAFALSLSRALQHGVLQGYRVVEDALPSVRGRIDLGTHLARRPGLTIPIHVRYDDFVVDIPENQVLRSALHRLLALPGVPTSVRGQLSRMYGQLDGVTVLRPRDPIPSWRPTRLNARYQPAVRLAEVILRNLSVTPGGMGGPRVAAFVVEMWRVFEDFVTVALREALRGFPGHTSVQLPAYLAGPGDWRSGEIPMYVDLVHHAPDGRPVAVVDAKYKIASGSGQFANADHYQMLAYCTALRVPTAWLVYAAGSGSGRVRRVKNAGVEVAEYPLDLGTSPTTLLASISKLAEPIGSAAHRDPALSAR